MGPPWATGIGTVLLIAAILSLIFFPALLIVVGLAAIALVLSLVVAGGHAADRPPAVDPVTGGRPWWKKRWDE
jgi:hypothetical protein